MNAAAARGRAAAWVADHLWRFRPGSDPRASHRGGADRLLLFDCQPFRSSPVPASHSTCPTGIACRAFDHRPAAASHAA